MCLFATPERFAKMTCKCEKSEECAKEKDTYIKSPFQQIPDTWSTSGAKLPRLVAEASSAQIVTAPAGLLAGVLLLFEYGIPGAEENDSPSCHIQIRD
jgi:hypothetical protein